MSNNFNDIETLKPFRKSFFDLKKETEASDARTRDIIQSKKKELEKEYEKTVKFKPRTETETNYLNILDVKIETLEWVLLLLEAKNK